MQFVAPQEILQDKTVQIPPNVQQLGGFDFENVKRNAFLRQQGFKEPISKKTGTTICGLIFKDGVVLGADTRATEGPIVCDKNCEKIHYIAPNIYCCGAGTSADTENSTALISSQLELLRLNSGRESRVATAKTMLKQMLFKYQGHVSAALVLGGVDHTGSSLYTIYPHGSTDSLPYVTMGSGSLAAMAVFEAYWKPDLTREEGIKLVRDAIAAGVFNDLGSGGNIDITIITRGNVEILRNYEKANPRKYRRAKPYEFQRGTTPVVSTTVTPLDKVVISEGVTESMEL